MSIWGRVYEDRVHEIPSTASRPRQQRLCLPAVPQPSSAYRHSPRRNPRAGRTRFPGRHVGPTSLIPPVSKVTRITRRNFDLPPSHVPRLPVEGTILGRTPHASLASF